MEIRKAERKKAKLRLGIAAPSGAGKTYSALQLAFGLGGKVGVIDTENGSADLYAELGDFDVVTLTPDYTVKKYLEALTLFENAGYTTVIIDSLSHAWSGQGGLLDKQGKVADKTGNGWQAWRQITPEHNELVERMLRSPCHIIATMRAKTDYVQEKDDRTGKSVVRKIGLAPIQRDGMEYEFSIMLDIDMNHVASTSKDRTQLFDGQYFKVSQDTGKTLLAWLNSGAEPGLTKEQVLDHLCSIEGAATQEELFKVFATAYRQAGTMNDASAITQFTDAKNKRKTALEAATAQPEDDYIPE